jgi:hypothetical protein
MPSRCQTGARHLATIQSTIRPERSLRHADSDGGTQSSERLRFSRKRSLPPVLPRPLVNLAPIRVENAHSPRAIWPLGALGQGNRADDVQCIGAPLREDGARAIEKLDAEIHRAQHERQRPAHGSRNSLLATVTISLQSLPRARLRPCRVQARHPTPLALVAVCAVLARLAMPSLCVVPYDANAPWWGSQRSGRGSWRSTWPCDFSQPRRLCTT